jgi:ferredoxin
LGCQRQVTYPYAEVMTLRVEVDREACISAGKCVATAPAFFHFDDDELVVIDRSTPTPNDQLLMQIAASCPSQAIQVFDGDQRIDA